MFVFPDGKIHYGYFATDRMLLSAAPPRETEAISPQVRIYIGDLLKNMDISISTEVIATVTSTIERLLLRFNTSIRMVHKKYLDLSLSRKKKDSEVVLDSWTRLEKLFVQSRNIHKRFFVNTLADFWRFAREFSIITPHYTAYNVAQQLKRLRINRRRVARCMQIDQELAAIQLIREAEISATAALLAAQSKKNDKSKRNRLLPQNIQNNPILSNGQLSAVDINSNNNNNNTNTAGLPIPPAATTVNVTNSKSGIKSKANLSNKQTSVTTVGTASGGVILSKGSSGSSVGDNGLPSLLLPDKNNKGSPVVTNTAGVIDAASSSATVNTNNSSTGAPLKAQHPAFLDDLYDESVATTEFSSIDRALDPRSPLREYEFVELIVRCVLESEAVSGLLWRFVPNKEERDSNTNTVSGINNGRVVNNKSTGPADVIYRMLSDKVIIYF